MNKQIDTIPRIGWRVPCGIQDQQPHSNTSYASKKRPTRNDFSLVTSILSSFDTNQQYPGAANSEQPLTEVWQAALLQSLKQHA